MQTDLLRAIDVLVTRPTHQAQELCALFEQAGARVTCFPVIAIEAVQLTQKVLDVIVDIDKIDFAVFISPNAVTYGIAQLVAHGKIPATLKLVTIGKASADKLYSLLGKMPDIYPREQYHSEALLALESMQKEYLQHKQVLIFRGCGGREFLAQSLRQRGAKVSYAEVYQRLRPEPEDDVLDVVFNLRLPDIITLTSNEGLNNLVSMLKHAKSENKLVYLNNLWRIPLLVVTEKMRDNARSLGFTNTVVIADKASNNALLEGVVHWSTKYFNNQFGSLNSRENF